MWLSDFKARVNDRIVIENFGGSTTRFDIVRSGSDVTYTFDGTGTEPDFYSLIPGIKLDINALNFNAANNVRSAIIKSVTYNTFVIENVSGVTESNKTIGTGTIKILRQNFLDAQYIEWANSAINAINKVADSEIAEITTTTESDGIETDVLEIINEYVLWKWNEAMGTKVAGGFMYRDGINTVDKKGTAKQYQDQAKLNKKNYEDQLRDYATDQDSNVGIYSATLIRS